MVDCYTIVGYDKDNDVYFVLDDGYTLSIEAELEAKQLVKLMEKSELCGENGEPIDWIEIYHDYGGDNEDVVWTSYLPDDEET